MNSLGIGKAAPLVLGLLLSWNLSVVCSQDEAQMPTIDFTTSIKPIIESRCATCHNENDEEGGLNLTDTDRLLEYIKPGKPLESTLYQSLTGANSIAAMPPEEDNDGNLLEPCSNSEMALIYFWIQQGAKLDVVKAEPKEEAPKSAGRRIFLFLGYFHPAVVHFPIALITMSAVFIILFFRIESLSDDAAYYLLFFGMLASIVACVFGWAFAEKNPVVVTDISLGINRHRWFGIGATASAFICVILGWRARNEVIGQRSGLWKFGVILTAALMGIVGHQGGEEVYGEGMYERAAEKLIPEYWPFGNQAADDPAKTKDEGNNTGVVSTENNGNADGKQTGNDQTGNDQTGEDQSNPKSADPDDVEQDKPTGSDTEKSAEDPSKKDNEGGNEKSGSDLPPSDPTIKSDDQ